MNLKVAVLSLDIALADRDRNLLQVGAWLQGLDERIDLLVLPELFSTGFVSDQDTMFELAEPVSGKTMETVRRWAREYDIAISGSYVAISGRQLFNRGFFVEPSGDEAFYDKRHLFCGSPEARMMTHGREHLRTVRYRGWNISMVICYDIRFPVWCRNVGQLCDLLLVPANWPESRGYAWKHLLIGRAIENQMYVIGANRSGKDEYGVYDNLSFAIDPLGKELRGDRSGNGAVIVSLDKGSLEETRRRLPVVRDAEKFEITVG